MRLKEIADRLNCELQGDPNVEIIGVAGIEEASENELTFLSNPKYIHQIKTSRAGAIIVGENAPPAPAPTLLSDNPYLTFAHAIELFYAPPKPIPGIHPTAWIADSAQLGEDCSIGANAVIGEHVKIGARAVLYPNVTVYPYVEIGDDFIAHSNTSVREYCRIGSRVILQNGAVIGADGFGFAPTRDETYYKIVQSGIVTLEDDVEIGANTCVDRGTIGETRIGKGTKLDNLVQVGHGSQVGQHSVLAAQAGLAGSSRVGNHVMLGGQVGVSGHLTIGDRVIATAQTGIAKSVAPGSMISGSPEVDTPTWKKTYLLMKNFPELVRTIRRMAKDIEALKKQIGLNQPD